MAYPTYHIFIFIKCVTKTYNVAKYALMLRAICVKKKKYIIETFRILNVKQKFSIFSSLNLLESCETINFSLLYTMTGYLEIPLDIFFVGFA